METVVPSWEHSIYEGEICRQMKPESPTFLASVEKSSPLIQKRSEFMIIQRSGILYLASDASAYVTSSELVIDGGWTAQ